MILIYENWYEMLLARYGFLGTGMAECQTRDGIRLIFRKATTDHSIINDIFARKSYDKFSPIQNGFTVIDIGANIGAFSIYAASKGAVVYSYEPEKENFKLLNKNISLNHGKEKIHPFNLAVGGKSGLTSLFISKENVGGHSIFPSPKLESKQNVRITTLTDILRGKRIEKCDFLKLDCEGAEYDILFKITKNMLAKIKRIGMEYHRIKGRNYKDMIKFLGENGFKVEATKPSKIGMGIIYASRN
ncbi:MAG: FkbM family methyltransferase [Candidatus Aenigmarchaeota archaeon]|nr:FkbM family methyltransferase [Candidatus Aenigmarchaeota archaeon]